MNSPAAHDPKYPNSHRGVAYSILRSEGDVWRWQFRIGDHLRSGKTEARLYLLAERRVQVLIDRALKAIERD